MSENPILQAKDILKYAYDSNGHRTRGSNVRLLSGASIELRAGEVHALVGANGAGKTTLIKVMAGAIPLDGGELLIDGAPPRFKSMVDVRETGISVIWQEFSLAPKLTVAENIFLGRESFRSGQLDRHEMLKGSRDALERLGSNTDPHARVSSLATSAQQVVEIARAISEDSRIIILDEPTASLSRAETDKLFEVLNDLRQRGMSILLVTHRLDEVFEMADRVTVLKDGKSVGSAAIDDLTIDKLIEMMVGQSVTMERIAGTVSTETEPVLETKDLMVRGGRIPVSINVHPGEIVGLAGLVGAGRTELARTIVGADRSPGGQIILQGRDVSRWSMRKRLGVNGMGFVPEDRKTQGVILPLSLTRNVTLPNTSELGAGPLVSPRSESSLANKLVNAVRITAQSTWQLASTLSGGNQQRLVIGKWLAQPRALYVLDEPTRGVDVSARRALYDLMLELARAGSGILMISSDLPEIMAMSHRIYVMRNGAISAEFLGAEAQEEQLLTAMFPDVPLSTLPESPRDHSSH